MSAKMKRRRRHDRLKRILLERRFRREDAIFFETGRFPASIVSACVCSCGARAFSRTSRDQSVEEFYDAHAYCDDEVYS